MPIFTALVKWLLKIFRIIFKHFSWQRGYYVYIETSTMKFDNVVLSLWQRRCCVFWTINRIFFPPWAEWPIYCSFSGFKVFFKFIFYQKVSLLVRCSGLYCTRCCETVTYITAIEQVIWPQTQLGVGYFIKAIDCWILSISTLET